MTDLDRVVQRLELLADRLEGLLSEKPPTPPPDPQAVEAANKYLEQRKWELRGEEEPFDA